MNQPSNRHTLDLTVGSPINSLHSYPSLPLWITRFLIEFYSICTGLFSEIFILDLPFVLSYSWSFFFCFWRSSVLQSFLFIIFSNSIFSSANSISYSIGHYILSKLLTSFLKATGITISSIPILMILHLTTLFLKEPVICCHSYYLLSYR